MQQGVEVCDVRHLVFCYFLQKLDTANGCLSVAMSLLLIDQLPEESQSKKPDHAPHSASYLEVRYFSFSTLVPGYRRTELLLSVDRFPENEKIIVLI